MSARSDARKLLRAAELAGAEVVRGSRHAKVYANGALVTVVSGSGARGRSGNLRASRRALRRAGVLP